MKKIILGTLVLLTIGMGFGFAQTQKKNDTETKSKDYYEGYKQAANDYSKKKQKYNIFHNNLIFMLWLKTCYTFLELIIWLQLYVF